jgi:hypothetical protein
MTAQMEDGHGFLDTKYETCFRSRAVPRFLWDWVKNCLVITDVIRVQGGEELEPGDVVLFIDGIAIDQVISEKERFNSAASDARRAYFALQESLRGERVLSPS